MYWYGSITKIHCYTKDKAQGCLCTSGSDHSAPLCSPASGRTVTDGPAARLRICHHMHPKATRPIGCSWPITEDSRVFNHSHSCETRDTSDRQVWLEFLRTVLWPKTLLTYWLLLPSLFHRGQSRVWHPPPLAPSFLFPHKERLQ